MVYRAWRLGAVVYYVGGNVLEMTLPLVICNNEIDRGTDILDRALADAIAGPVTNEEVRLYASW